MKTAAVMFLLASSVLACDERPSPPAPPAAFMPQAPVNQPAQVASPLPPSAAPTVPAGVTARPAFAWEPTISNAAGACSVGQPVSLGGKEGRLESLAIGFGPSGGLVTWPMDAGRAQTVPLRPDGAIAGMGAFVDISAANRIREVLAFRDGFALFTHAVCPDQKHFFKCLHHRLLSPTGQPLGAEGTHVTKEWIGVERTARRGDTGLTRLWSFMYIPPVVTAIDAAGALSVSEVARLEGLGEVVNAEAFTTTANGWAAVFSDETEDSAKVFLSSGGARVSLAWVPREARVLSLRQQGDGLSMLFRVGDNPKRGARLARLTHAGAKIDGPTPLAADGALPSPFQDDLSVSLKLDKRDLFLVRTDAAGREIGDPVPVGVGLRPDRDPVPYGWAWTGDRFVVAFGTVEGGQWKLYATPVTCSGLVGQ